VCFEICEEFPSQPAAEVAPVAEIAISQICGEQILSHWTTEGLLMHALIVKAMVLPAQPPQASYFAGGKIVAHDVYDIVGRVAITTALDPSHISAYTRLANFSTAS